MIKKEQYSRIKIIFLFGAIALIVLSILSYVRIKNLIEASELVLHTEEVKLELERTMQELLRAESSHRGYIHAKDSSFLNDYFKARSNVYVHLSKADSLIINPFVKQQAIALHAAIDKRLDYMKSILDVAASSEVSSQRWLVGKALMDEVREQVDKTEFAEEQLMNQRVASLNKETFMTPLFTVCLIIGAILILVGAYFKIMKELKISDSLKSNVEQRSNELLQANEELAFQNEEKEKRTAELVIANKELESFNYISSHDLQEPLRQIQNFSSRIITDEQQNLSDKGKNYLEKMNNAANRMQTLIADLLVYSRTKTAERKFEITDLNQIVKDVTAEFKETIDEKHATIEVGEMCDANVIPFQFRQLMHNLIGNSLKFSSPNIPPHIKISSCNITHSKPNNANLTPEKEYCHISITDNGIGFEPQYKDRIFEVFQRLHDKQKINGTGIGLAIVKKIVENHNGIITATSKLNGGATFDIYIPST